VDLTIAKLRIFALEVALGVAVGALGLMQLVYGVPPWFSDPEMLRKFATSLITIGGTLVGSGVFRFLFSMRIEATERNVSTRLEATQRSILGQLDDVTRSIVSTIGRMLPDGVASRPSEKHMEYRHLYWRTEDLSCKPIWLRFSELQWKRQILPFLEARAAISEFSDAHEYLLAMVELRDHVVIVATRLGAHEMAGVYSFAVPLVKGDQFFGCLRHISMARNECISACILSRVVLSAADLDRMWAESHQGIKMVMNFPSRLGQLALA
jgi:hypothetical protein